MQHRPYRWLWISLLAGFILAVGNFIGHVPSYVSASGPMNPKHTQTPQAQSGTPDTVEEFENDSIEAEGEDPDLPSFFKGKINKKEYLRRRGEYFAKLRGLPHFLPYEPRSQAIRMMEQQEVVGRRLGLVPNINSSTWTSVGPDPIPNGQTTTTSRPVSGRVASIAIHPTNPNIVYVGTAQGGLYRSLDGGTTWTALMDSAQSLAIGAVAIAPSQPSTVYVGTGEASSSADGYFGVGMYRIDNADTTPTLTGPINPLVTTGIANTTAFTGRTISKIVVHPTDPATIFVGTSTGIGGIGATGLSGTVPPLALRGVYRSTNATSASPTFTKLTVTAAGSIAPDTSGNRSVSDLVLDPGDSNVLVVGVVGNAAANDGGCYRSTNALAATPIFTQTRTTVTTNGSRIELAVNRVSTTTTILAATGDSSTGRLYRSTDAGVTWSAAIAGASGYCGGQCFYDIAVAIDPNNSNNIYIGGSAEGTNTRIFSRSTNGTTFTGQGVASVGLHADTHAIAVAPSNPAILFTGNDGGIFKSTDSGATWTSCNNSTFIATQFQSIALHPTDRQFMIGGTQDNGTQMKRADGTWTRADFGDGGFALIDQNAANTTNVTMYHTYFNQIAAGLIGFGRVILSTCASDNNWVGRGAGFGTNATLGCDGTALAISNGLSTSDTNVLFYAPMALGPGNPNTLYFGTDRLYRSTDRGDTMPRPAAALVSGVAVSAIGIHPSNDNIRIVGLAGGQVFGTTTGAVPTVKTGTLPARYVARAVMDPNVADRAYVTNSGFAGSAGQNVWRTDNFSAATPTWTNAGAGIPDVPVNAFVIDPLNSNYLYAGTDIGVYRSTDAGTSWNPYSNGLPRVAVFDMAIQATSRVLRIATHGRGIWEIIPDNFTNTTVSIINVNPTYIAANPTYTGGQINVAADLRNTGASNLNSRVYFRITDLSKVPVDATQLELTTAANGAGKNDDIQNILTAGSLAPSTNMAVSGGFNIGRDTPVTPVRLFGDIYTTALTSPQATKLGTFQFNTSDFIKQRAQFGVNHIESESRFDLVQNQEYPVISGIGAQSTAVIAVDPKNAQRMAVASEDIRTHTIIVRLSDNGGNSWRTTVVNPTVGGTTYYGAHHPSLAFSPTGELYVTFVANNLEDSGCAVALVTTGDRLTLGTPTALASYTAADRRIASRPTVAVSPDGRATVAWDVFNATTGQFEIQVGRGRKLGDQGGTPVVTVAQGTVAAPTLTFGPKGNLLVGWLEWDASLKADQGGRVRVATSADGVTFEPAVVLGETGIGFGRVMGAMPDRGAGPNLSLAVDKNGSVYASYAGAGEGMDLYLVRSDDNGRSWSAPTVVNDVTKGDQFHPALAVDASGTVLVSYYDTRNSTGGGEVDVYLARSTNRGVSFGASERVTTRSSNDSVTNPNRDAAANLGSRIGVAATANGVFVVWTDTRNGNEDVYFCQRAGTSTGVK